MTKANTKNADWTMVISPKSNMLSLQLEDIWRYKDLLYLFVRRDFVSIYKQTILGPAWFFIQPILTTITYTIIFGNVAGLSTDGLPKMIFYLSGVVCWSYFSDCITTISSTFIANAQVFGKVYFPRLIAPLSVVISKLIKLGIQFLLFIVTLLYYVIFESTEVSPNIYLLLSPVLVLLMGGLGLGLGLLISSLTTKYRDMRFLIAFGVQLLMYGTPVIYPLSKVPEEYRLLVTLNPITPVVEAFRYGFLGTGTFSVYHLVYSFVFTVIALLLGIVVFNRVEKTFMDSV
ncbi:ABC transporter permease [Fulvivirgaceae bacterium BMA12]|uniref:Transport permease protein n=1 Tax=Agaribacillus aureus TaxID=3051825 RepID=A0ABT8L4V4_9BACT|nr:ABC transporter permease [Fulvivirgaceae bacterium BMA12]